MEKKRLINMLKFSLKLAEDSYMSARNAQNEKISSLRLVYLGRVSGIKLALDIIEQLEDEVE